MLASIALGSSIYGAKSVEEQLQAAVQSADIIQVKKYLRKLDRQNLTSQDKKNILARVALVSDEALSAEAKPGSLMSSPWDMARIVGGAMVGIYACSQIVHAFHKIRYKACQYCKGLHEGRQHCECTGCGDDLRYCTCVNRKVKMNGVTRLRYGITGLPYAGLAAAGFYTMYQGFCGATQKSRTTSLRNVHALLTEKVGGR